MWKEGDRDPWTYTSLTPRARFRSVEDAPATLKRYLYIRPLPMFGFIPLVRISQVQWWIYAFFFDTVPPYRHENQQPSAIYHANLRVQPWWSDCKEGWIEEWRSILERNRDLLRQEYQVGFTAALQSGHIPGRLPQCSCMPYFL